MLNSNCFQDVSRQQHTLSSEAGEAASGKIFKAAQVCFNVHLYAQHMQIYCVNSTLLLQVSLGVCAEKNDFTQDSVVTCMSCPQNTSWGS